MSGFVRAVGEVASIASVALMFVPGGQVIAGIAKAATLLKIASGVALAANLGAALTAKKPNNERQGQQLQFSIDPGGPIPIVLGRTMVGGTIVYRETYGTDNSYQTYAVALSFGLRNGIETFTADKVAVPKSGTGVTGYYANWMWLDFQSGATPESDALVNGITAPPYGTAGPMPGWGASYKLSGYTASTLSELYDTKARRYASGEPAPGWIVLDPVCYDPRQDSTVAGGSGDQRWADPSDREAHEAARATWTTCNTPAIVGLMWRLGIWLCDESDDDAVYQRVAGIGAPIDLIDLPRIMEAATVQEAAGMTLGGQVDTSLDKWTVLKMIDEAGAAEPVANGAALSIFQQMPRTAIATLTEADLADGAITAPGMVSRKNKLNGYRARFRSEDHGWEMTDINIVQIPDYVTADGRPKTDSGDFDLVQDADQCATLAAYKIFDSRELSRSLPLKPSASGFRIGDCLSIDMPGIGLVETDVVRGRSLSPASTVTTLALRTESDGKHAAALGQTATVPPTPTLSTISDEVAAPDEADWSAEGATLTANGASIPAIVITRTVTDGVPAQGNAASDAIVFDYRVYDEDETDDDANWNGASYESPAIVRKEIGGVLTPGTQYQVGVRYRVRGAIGDRLILGPETAGDLSTPRGAYTLKSQSAVYPITSDADSITIAAFTATLDDGSAYSFDDGSITGLSESTFYGVFAVKATGAYFAAASPAASAMASSANIFLGWQATSDVSGDYPTTGDPPGGNGGISPHPILNNPTGP